ncbi:hypothetical protein GOBAR_AA40437 [Gossypium barbadense]|uniref:Uncharacterized protein n=1 Tax=Gossypium barbadense TaxID=3634 RepID=A0A2P5S0S8_GOSBA|nr:hypothetical protein GOBAR_DD10388 [Gossypium barbadense]PPR80284.1 hypothetical protein GOBAR_AA40437 [Gossypium barbadense]
MSDKVPSSSPTVAAAAKGGTDEPPPSTTAPANGGAKKTHLYNPTSRPTYRPQPHHVTVRGGTTVAGPPSKYSYSFF